MLKASPNDVEQRAHLAPGVSRRLGARHRSWLGSLFSPPTAWLRRWLREPRDGGIALANRILLLRTARWLELGDEARDTPKRRANCSWVTRPAVVRMGFVRLLFDRSGSYLRTINTSVDTLG
jgi:hypothetical protein